MLSIRHPSLVGQWRPARVSSCHVHEICILKQTKNLHELLDGLGRLEQVKKEMEQLEKAEIGNPKTPLLKTPYLSDEIVDGINEGISCGT